MKKIAGAISVSVLVLCSQVGVASALQAMPMTTTSYYVNTTDTETDAQLQNWAYQKGYALGQQTYASGNATDNAVILDFGQPRLVNGVYGASGYKSGTNYLSTNSITLAALYFAYGYWNGIGTVKATPLRMIIGTSNSGMNSWTDANLYTHGQTWINMVKNIQYNVQYYGWSSKVATYGGNDIEMGYAPPAKTMQWVNGYNSQYASGFYLFDFGDANSCPQSGTTNVPAACANGWNQENVWQVSWGNYSYPFPEIYSTAGGNAKQWQQLSLYSYLAHGGAMYITAPLSQSLACAQRGGCTGTNNTPSQAWSQMWTYLNGDSRTAQNLIWSSDIAWKF